MIIPMTAAGHAALQEELRHRLRSERPRLARQLQQAIADDPNLVENSEYQATLAEQGVNDTRIAELEDMLAHAEVIDVSRLSGETVTFGVTVTLIDEKTGDKRICQIVGEPEADARKGRVSVSSPIARALIGKRKGPTVVVEAPGGERTYQIQQVAWSEHHQVDAGKVLK